MTIILRHQLGRTQLARRIRHYVEDKIRFYCYGTDVTALTAFVEERNFSRNYVKLLLHSVHYVHYF